MAPPAQAKPDIGGSATPLGQNTQGINLDPQYLQSEADISQLRK
jgi:hypothetical protein